MLLKFSITFALLLSLAACKASDDGVRTTSEKIQSDALPTDQIAATFAWDVFKIKDPANGATCYVMRGIDGRGGISCIPGNSQP